MMVGFAIAALCYASIAMSDLDFVAGADVSPTSVSIVSLSTESVQSVSLEVFTDADGLSPYAAAQITAVSAANPDAHASGISVVRAMNLLPDATYYFRLIVSGPSGDVSFPTTSPYYGITTATAPESLGTGGQLQLNELVSYRPYSPNAVINPQSMLVLLSVPGTTQSPIASFVDPGAPIPAAYFDLNNAVTSSGTRVSLGGGIAVQIVEHRGLPCANKAIGRFRRTNSPTPAGSPLVPQALGMCFSSDTNCDDTINVLDFQHLLNSLNSVEGDCEFNPDLDIIIDTTIDILDLDEITNRFGENAPFN